MTPCWRVFDRVRDQVIENAIQTIHGSQNLRLLGTSLLQPLESQASLFADHLKTPHNPLERLDQCQRLEWLYTLEFVLPSSQVEQIVDQALQEFNPAPGALQDIQLLAGDLTHIPRCKRSEQAVYHADRRAQLM